MVAMVTKMVTLISKTKLFVFTSVPNIFGLVLVEQIIFHCLNQLEIEVCAKPTMSENDDV